MTFLRRRVLALAFVTGFVAVFVSDGLLHLRFPSIDALLVVAATGLVGGVVGTVVFMVVDRREIR